MANRVVSIKNWSGGWSIDPKIGVKYSSAYIQAFDFRKSPSQITSLPRPNREDAGVVTDLVQNEVMVSDGTIYAIGSTGAFYRRTIGGIWSLEANIDSVGCFGMDFRFDTDSIYICGTKNVSMYGKVSTAPQMNGGFYTYSVATSNTELENGTDINPNQVGNAGTAIYTTPIAVNESTTNTRYFQSDIEPLNQIAVYVVSKGTGNLTLTLHDGLNNVLATSTLQNANVNNNAFNNFTFSGAENEQVRIYVAPNARTYHFHVTSTVADATIATSLAGSLGNCDVQVYADRLIVTTNGMHPATRFLQYECFGNANYVSVWEPLELDNPPPNYEWLRHRLVFPMEYECCGLAATNEFLAIAMEKTSTNTASVPQEGVIAFWDGTSTTYNYFIRIPEGSPYAIHEYKNIIYYYAGGSWWAIGSPTSQPYKLRTMPNSDTELNGLWPLDETSGDPFTVTLSDNFNGAGSTPDSSKWTTFNYASQANGMLNLTSTLAASASGVNSIETYDLTGSVMQIRINAIGNQALTTWEVYPLMAQLDSSNQLFWVITQNNILTFRKVAGSSTQMSTATFSAANYQFVRIREDNGIIYFDYSGNGLTWANASNIATPFDVTSITQYIFSDTYGAEVTTTVAQLDDFNVIAPSSPIVVYPYSATVRRDIHLMGWPGKAYSPDINYGVYSWGASNKNLPETFGYNYVISTGAQNVDVTNDLAIGMVKSFGDILQLSWQDNGLGAVVSINSVVDGPESPTVGGDYAAVGTLTWDSPQNITLSDNTYTSITTIAGGTSHYLVATNFRFNIPPGSTITGIKAEIEHVASAATTNNVKDATVKLIKADGTLSTTNLADTVNNWATSDAVISYGSSSQLWGETWTADDINNINFGVVLSATLAVSSTVSASVDHVRVTVYYTSTVTDGKYGVDVVNNSSPPADFSSFESLIFDNGVVSKLKTGMYIKVNTVNFPADAFFLIKYKIDRGDWVYSDNIFSTDLINGQARFDITSPSRFHEIQCGIDVYPGEDDTPTFNGISLVFEDNTDESEY